MSKITKSLRELFEDVPKRLTKDYLQSLNAALYCQKLEPDIDTETVVSSLLVEIIDKNASTSNRFFAYAILQKLQHVALSSEIISADLGQQLIYILPILITQSLKSEVVIDVIKKLVWYLSNENWPELLQSHALAFLCKAVASPDSPLAQDDMEKLFYLLSSWLIVPLPKPQVRVPGIRKSSSSLSITEVDSGDTQDIFSILIPVSNVTSKQLQSTYTFSVMRSTLTPSDVDGENFSKQVQPYLGASASESLSSSVYEYCMRIIDQVDRKAQSSTMWKFQKICLVEAIELLNIVCFMDSGIIHSIFPVIRHIYNKISSNLSKEPEIEEICVLSSCMQFFINHGKSVMHKPDSLYVFLFCDILGLYFKDNCISYEILNLMHQNISQLCYHSSILEKYFPTFLKVFAWHSESFAIDFLDVLPAFMSQNTSLEIFYSLLDLPCLTAILVLMDNKSCMEDPKMLRDPKLLESLEKPEINSFVKFLLRETSGDASVLEGNIIINLLHQTLQSLASHKRVVRCSKAVIPLLKCYFQVLVQYADMSVSVHIILAILERVSVIYSVPNYSKEVNIILGDYIRKLFKEHPEAVFHCQKNVISYLSQFRNYFISERCFLHMIGIVGEYVTPTYSSMCKPETVSFYFENLETTAYEALSCLKDDSDDYFLKLLSIISVTLSKLAARNQDQVPRAVLYLTKLHQHLKSFGNGWKKSWKIVTERVEEMLGILSEPSIAAVILNPPKDLLSGRYHRDPTSLANVLRTITAVVNPDS